MHSVRAYIFAQWVYLHSLSRLYTCFLALCRVDIYSVVVVCWTLT